MMKKIVHICMTVFSDEMAYQENVLTKYHAKMGAQVTVITSTWKYKSGGKELVETGDRDYINQDGVRVRRLPIKGKKNIHKKFRRFKGVYETLCDEKPDILFIHGCQYLDISIITKYIKKHHIHQVYVDNHADFSNSATNWISKEIQHKIIWRYYAQMIEPYTTDFYGVLPARVDFLQELYKLPKEKCRLLVMGADDEYVIKAKEYRKYTREKYNIGINDFLVVTGGKIDKWKKQTVFLEDAVKKIRCNKLKLIIFGSIDKELRNDVIGFCDERITYVGWLPVEETYHLIAAADLAVYPGRHSTLWEQTTGQGIPMLVKHWEGTHHVDMGGNVRFLYEDSCEEMKNILEELLIDVEQYHEMKTKAEYSAKEFLYSNIARVSIEETQ